VGLVSPDASSRPDSLAPDAAASIARPNRSSEAQMDVSDQPPPGKPNAMGSSEPSRQKDASKLDAKALAVVNELRQTDRSVRAHEAAHIAAGRQYVTGGASFQFNAGPDGKQYAVAGEVDIDTSAVPGDPKATIAKMEVVQRAALAPSEPSAQDRSVAAAAARKASQARLETATSPESENIPLGNRIDRQA